MRNMNMEQMDHLSEVEKYKERLNIALKAAKICVFEVDLTRQLYTFFENAEDIFGVSGSVILNDVRPYSQLDPDAYQKAVSGYFSHPDDAEIIDRAFKSIFSGKSVTYQARMRAGGSDFLWCKLDVTPIMENGIPIKMIGVITDISDLNRKIDTLKKAANVDSFTGLSNKSYSMESIKKALSAKTGQKHALVLLDIDHFKSINDTFGHDVGDILLKTVAEDLKSAFRKKDILGRFGGDEFIVLVRDIASVDWLKKKLQPLTRCGNGTYQCSNSIGVAFFPDDGDTFEQLFKNADTALYTAKLTNGTFTFFGE